ncbi:MAG: DUF72 domain-containing protein [Acidiferrobacterales bacterium]
MTKELMVGTTGWDHNDWVVDYYPDDLPDDWRFAYYSNDHRSVLVPADHFQTYDEDALSELLEDCDESFRFVVEIPETCLEDTGTELLQAFLNGISSLYSRLGGFYLPLGEATSQGVARLPAKVKLLQEHGPLCIDFEHESGASEQLIRLMADNNIGLCWHPECDDEPTTGGALMLVLSDEETPRAHRHIIEALEEWMQQSYGLTGLFLKTSAAASQARIIAEMLGV